MKVIYVFDALCGWCYGFSPVISELCREHRRQLPFEVISGGMVRGERAGPVVNFRDHIRDSKTVIEEKTGIKFGDAFLDGLEEGTVIFDSTFPARALAVFKEMMPDKAVFYAEDIQRAIYFDGINPTNILPYVDMAAEYDLDQKIFKDHLQSPESGVLAEQDFARAAELEATGYPTVFFEYNGHRQLIARGYTALNVLEARFDHVVNRVKEE